jgi:hypothetical protein
VQVVVWCSHDWSARALCPHGRGRGLVDVVWPVQFLGGSIVVYSMWKLGLRLVGWRQVRQAARREGDRQSDGSGEVAGCQTLQGVKSKERSPRTKEELRRALCSMLRSVVRLRRCRTSHKPQGTRWMEVIGRSPKFLLLLGGRRAVAMLGRSVALAERLCATCASVSPGERSPRLCLQKYQSQQRERPD